MEAAFNRNEPFGVIALDVGGTKIAGGLVMYEQSGQAPSVAAHAALPTDARRGGAAVLQDMVSLATQLKQLAAQQWPEIPLAGVGADAAGCISPVDGSVLYANEIMPEWTGQPVAERLSHALELPATNMGDVHAHALGEARWGAARGLQSVLMVAIGTGLGGAYVLDGKVVRGFHGAAGHIGHSLHRSTGEAVCSCGGVGHAESITSGTAISALYQGKRIGDELDPALMGDAVSERAAAGEEKAIQVLTFAGRALGEAIGSWCNILDPQCVVLSGSVVKAGPIWRAAVDEGFKMQALQPLADTPIVEGSLGDDAPLIGAAENLVDSL